MVSIAWLPTRPKVGRRLPTLVSEFLAERERWALWTPVLFGGGIAAYFAMSFEPPFWVGTAALAVPGAAFLLVRRSQAARLPAAIALVVGAGFFAAVLRTDLVSAPVLAREVGPTEVIGEVLVVEAEDQRPRILLGSPIVAGLSPAETPARLRIRLLRRDETVVAGEWIRLRAILRPLPEPVAPGAFDFARQAYFEQLGAVGFALGAPQRAAPPQGEARDGGTLQWWLLLSRWREAIARRILTAIPGESGAIAAALLTGDRSAIGQDSLAAMRDSGLAHLLAISGLHLGIVAGLLFVTLRAAFALVPALALRRPIKKWAAIGAVLGALGYLLLVGAPVPTQRAFLMVGIVLLGVLVDRVAVSLRLVAWAALAVLAWAPESLLGPSFQMSFAAVIALIAGYEALAERRQRMIAGRGLARRFQFYLSGLVLTSLIAGAATAPFALFHFNRMAWYGLAANLFAVPLTAFWIMPWGILSLALLPVGGEAFGLIPMAWGIEAMLAVARGVAAWPGAVSTVPSLPVSALAAIALGALWLCLWRRPWRLGGLPAVAGGFASLLFAAQPDLLVSGNAQLVAIDAGDSKLWLSQDGVERFSAEQWQRRLGLEERAIWPWSGAALDRRLRCESAGCTYEKNGLLVAVPRDPRALAEDCRLADIVISATPLRRLPCDRPLIVIDRFDLWREGAHALWLSADGVIVKTVAAERGVRPWVVSPERRRR